MADDILLEKIARGDHKALETIYLRYRHTLVMRGRYSFSCNLQDAEDLYQEAMVILETNLRNGLEIGTLEGYLFTIMRNLNSKNQKYAARVSAYEDLELLLRQLPQENLPYGGEAEIYIQKAMAIIDQMKDVCNSILKLRLLYDWSYEEIRENMNYSTSEGAKNQFSRCLKKLRDLFFGRNNP